MSIARSTALLGLAKFITIVLNILALPFYLRWLEASGYGQIEWIGVIFNYAILIFDPGLSASNQNLLAAADTESDQVKLGKIFRSHRTMLAGTGLAGLLVICGIPLLYRPEWYRFGPEYSLFFVLSGVQLFFYFQSIVYTGLYTSRRQFAPVASATTIASILNAVVSLTAVYITRHPWAFVLGTVVQGVVITGMLHYHLRKDPLVKLSFEFDRELYAPNFKFAKTFAPSNVGILLSQGDRAIIEKALSVKELGIYGAGTRLPAISCQLMPLAQVYQPELAGAFTKGEAEFAKMVHSALLVTFALITTVLFIPSGLAEPILRLVLREDFDPRMAMIFTASCFDNGFSVYGTMFSLCAISARKPLTVTPFILYMGIMSMSLAWPVSVHFGIEGIAWTRAILQATQFFVIEWVIRKYLAPSFPLVAFVKKKLMMLGAGSIFWLLGHFACQLPVIKEYPALSLLLIPALTLPYLLVLIRTRTISMPDKITRKLPFLKV